MSDLNRASFVASIPPIMTGIKTGGDGMRVQFDIPEDAMGEGAAFVICQGQAITWLSSHGRRHGWRWKWKNKTDEYFS